MPEPITTLTVGALALYFTEKAGGKVVEKSIEAIWEKCRQWFQGEKFISIFEDYHDSPKAKDELTTHLDDLVKKDPEAKAELETMLDRLPRSTITNVQNITGIGNIGIQGVSGSTININNK